LKGRRKAKGRRQKAKGEEKREDVMRKEL